MKKLSLFDDVFSALCEHIAPQATEVIDVMDANGRTLACPAYAIMDVPPFSRAMMDGFAVRFEDVNQGVQNFDIRGLSKAGTPYHGTVDARECVRIMTGAALPQGADTVIRYEWCTEPTPGQVQVHRTPAARGESVQMIGDDGHAGDKVLGAGRTLGGVEVAVCRSFGIREVTVYRKPNAALVITGDELVQDQMTPLGVGQIYGTNDTLIQYALEEDSVNVTEIAYARDDVDTLKELLEGACKTQDFVIVTGGISAGDFDFVPQAVSEIGATIYVEALWMRPGSPFIVAKLRNTVILCLSGNPAAAFVQFETLVRPALRRSMGRQDSPFPVTGKLQNDIELKPIKHTRIHRARAVIHQGQVVVEPNGSQSPGIISSLSQTNCLIRLDEPSYTAGSVVPLRWYGNM